tara:strand:+ start:765 stop:4814 length:4050 start_codon:yes stop_codon:yes gene_type:complete
MNQIVNKTQNRDINDDESNQIRLLWHEYTNSLKQDGGFSFEEKYGGEAIDTLTESFRRLNNQTSGFSTAAELEASEMMKEATEDLAYNGLPKKRETNVAKQIGKGGVRGAALLWNGIVDIGRGAIDPENWAYVSELMTSVGDGLAFSDRNRSWEKYWEEVKKDAVRGDKGFANAWARTVLEENEIDKYTSQLDFSERDIYNVRSAGMSGIKFDNIPFLNEDLGMAGAAAEIAVQELLTMGPLALGKLHRANKVAKYFSDKAGGSIKRGKMTKDGYRSGRTRTELGDESDIKKAVDEQDVEYKEYYDELKGMSAKEQKKTNELLKINQTKGKVLKFGGGAYAEAEIVASAGVVAGGIWFQSMFGKEASIIGEVGGGLLGPSVGMKSARNVLDWMNYLAYKLPGNVNSKNMRGLKALGYTDDEITKMAPTKKAKIISALRAAPIPRWMGFSSKERKRLTQMRHWDNEFESLPDDIRDPLMERMDAVKGLLQRFDEQAGGTGNVFTTIDRAFDMAWLASLRTLARDKKRIGHGVKVKFDIDEMTLQKRELDTARELNKLLQGLSEKSYGNADFKALLHTMDTQLMKNMQKLAAEKGVVSKQANEIMKAVNRRTDGNLKQYSDYTDVGGFRNNWDDGIDITRKGDPDVLIDFDKAATDEIAKFFTDTKEPIINEALRRQGMRLIEQDGRKILMPVGRKKYSESVQYSNDSEKIFKDAYDADRNYGSAQYDSIDGFDVSPAKSTEGKAPAVESEQMNRITARLGEELLNFTETNPGMGARIISNIRGKDVSVEQFLFNERLKALKTAHRAMGDDEYFKMLDDIKNREGYEIDTVVTDPMTGGSRIDTGGMSNLESIIAGDLSLLLPSNNVKLDISLKDLHGIRSGLLKQGMAQTRTDAQRVTGAMNLRVADIVQKELDEFSGLREANEVWKTQVGDKWRRGVGRSIVSGIKQPEQFFKSFIETATPTRAREDFDRMFLGQDGLYDEQAIEGLNFAINEMLDNNQKLPNAFLKNFGEDVLGMRLVEGEDVVYKGQSIFRTTSDRATEYRKTAEGVTDEIAKDVDAMSTRMQENIELQPEFTFEGLSLAKMEGLFGKRIVDEQSLRKAILEESYIGGESRKLKGLIQLIKDAPPEVAKKNTETLQKVLYEGALEEAYNVRSTKGLGFTESAVEVMPDGSKQLQKGRLHEELDVDSGAFQLYLSRNKSVLEEIYKDTPEKLEDLRSLSALVTLVVGDIGQQAVENFPRAMKMQSLLSRAYGVVRGVVSPRYVMTELLIQHARFGRGKMITDLATDPDAFEILSDVILKDGLTKPRIRSEFVQYFYGTLMRGSRDILEAEGEGDLQTMSENAWAASGN